MLWQLFQVSIPMYYTCVNKVWKILSHGKWVNGLFSWTTWLSQHQKGNLFWILLKQEMMGWQWHQLDHMQIICTSLQRDNHASTSPLSFYRLDALTAAQPTASKYWRQKNTEGKKLVCLSETNRHSCLKGYFSPASLASDPSKLCRPESTFMLILNWVLCPIWCKTGHCTDVLSR